MRTILSVHALVALTLVLAGASTPSAAQSAPQAYPYCALDSSSGATSCYYDSRAQCGSRCIDNPGYVGPRSGMAGPRVWRRVPGR